MKSNYFVTSLIAVLTVALAAPATAQIGKLTASLVQNAPVMEIAAAIVFALFMLAVVVHEFSVILTLCPFAAPNVGEAANVSGKSAISH
jgi:hypothetical protein